MSFLKAQSERACLTFILRMFHNLSIATQLKRPFLIVSHHASKDGDNWRNTTLDDLKNQANLCGPSEILVPSSYGPSLQMAECLYEENKQDMGQQWSLIVCPQYPTSENGGSFSLGWNLEGGVQGKYGGWVSAGGRVMNRLGEAAALVLLLLKWNGMMFSSRTLDWGGASSIPCIS